MIFKVIIKFIIPYMLLFAFYIQINGEVSPGGGFQAGALIASIAIAYSMIVEKDLIKQENLLRLSSLGVVIYLLTGLCALFYGYNFLNYYYLSNDKHLAQFIGIFTIELGVAISISSVMLFIYYIFDQKEGEGS